MRRLILIEKQSRYVWSAFMMALTTFIGLFTLGVVKYVMDGSWAFYLVIFVGIGVLTSIKSKYTPFQHIFNINENNELKYLDKSINTEGEPNEFVVKDCTSVEAGLQVNLIASGAIKRKTSKVFRTELLGKANIQSLKRFIEEINASELNDIGNIFSCKESKIKAIGKLPEGNFFLRVIYKAEAFPVGVLSYGILLIGVYIINKLVGTN